jgi:hypothetical protein
MMMDSSDLTPVEIAKARAYMVSGARKRRMFLKVHDANLPYPGTLALPFAPENVYRVVHIVRDPRDVAVSLASHTGASLDLTIVRMADEDCVSGRHSSRLTTLLPQFVSSWTKHTMSWLDAPEFVRMTIRYESLLTDTTGLLEAVAQFLELDAPGAAIERSVKAARFEQLRNQEDSHGFRERPMGMERFFRRGIAGGWRDSLSEQQGLRIAKDHGRLMRQLGYLPD